MTDDEFDAGPPRRPTPEERAWVFETAEEEAARHEATFAGFRELGRRVAEEQNRRLLDSILPERMVILTPSLAALEALTLPPAERHHWIGVPVYVTPNAAVPTLVRARDVFDPPALKAAFPEYDALKRFRQAAIEAAVLGAGEPPADDQADAPLVVEAPRG